MMNKQVAKNEKELVLHATRITIIIDDVCVL